ncbi:MAG: OmpA family protein [Ignavibacteriales bacterium]|nr:MAG: OmpA family protein [Ignavibacteriales bacterium]
MKFGIFALLFCLVIAGAGFAQDGFFKKLKDKVKEKVEQKADEKVDEGIDKGLDGVEEGVEGAVEGSDEQTETTETQKENTTSETTGGNPIDKMELKSFSRYDFIPGDKVIFFEDFSQDNVGDFPAIWNTNSTGEVVTLNKFPGHWFKVGNDGYFLPDIAGDFGENFTFEFDLVYAPTVEYNQPDFELCLFDNGEGTNHFDLLPGSGGCGFKIGWAIATWNWSEGNYGEISNSKDNKVVIDNTNNRVRVSIAVQKQRVRLWVNENKIYDLPRLLSQGIKPNRIRFATWMPHDENPYLYITNLRVAAGLPDMRSKLITEGKLVVHGIYFDSGSDKIKPESYGTLKSISDVLKENADVNVQIVGHTDSDGNDASNLELSKKRAESVKNTLINDFSIDGSRLETEGKGETSPISDNNTAQGKANNRRVEFIKL